MPVSTSIWRSVSLISAFKAVLSPHICLLCSSIQRAYSVSNAAIPAKSPKWRNQWKHQRRKINFKWEEQWHHREILQKYHIQHIREALYYTNIFQGGLTVSKILSLSTTVKCYMLLGFGCQCQTGMFYFFQDFHVFRESLEDYISSGHEQQRRVRETDTLQEIKNQSNIRSAFI